MLRSDFEDYYLWALLDEIEQLVAEIRDQNSPPDQPYLEAIGFVSDYIRGFRSLSSTEVALFSPAMLDSVANVLPPVRDNLAVRVEQGPENPQAVMNAYAQIEAALPSLGTWPKPYAKGRQVQQMTTLFEDLLERQRLSVEALSASHDELRSQMADFRAGIDAKTSEAVAELEKILATARETAQEMETDRARVDTLLTNASETVASLQEKNAGAFANWREEQAQRFQEHFGQFQRQIEEREATSSRLLASLEQAEGDYRNLAAASSTDKLAGHYKTDAENSRRAGVRAYWGAIAVLAATAAALIFFTGSVGGTGQVNWEHLVLKISIGAIGAGAATIIVRLANRFLTTSAASKRMELELRTFNPFFANVDKEIVDTARVDLVDRSFGRAYGVVDGDATNDEVIPVSVLSQIVNSLSKLLGR
jgi:hypothetical protein